MSTDRLAEPRAIDPSIAFGAAALDPRQEHQPTGMEPLLGGVLKDKAVWVDESVCIGCRYCSHVCANTFLIEPDYGRSRAIRQDGDSSERIQEAIDTCPVDCIHWVDYEELPGLQRRLAQRKLQPLGHPSPPSVRRNRPRSPGGQQP
ncbi:MAG: ferredoxin [Aphanocapsa feldmannii 288cV]|nr:MAG: ferredoxin [Aphanocapsa feldmannii 288cV]